jgi:hypothetical protein
MRKVGHLCPVPQAGVDPLPLDAPVQLGVGPVAIEPLSLQ